MAFGEFCLRDTAGSFERARWVHLARSGSQSQRANWVILTTRGASHIINICYFMFSWQEQYLTSERSERVRYSSCHENIKFISHRHCVISSIYYYYYYYYYYHYHYRCRYRYRYHYHYYSLGCDVAICVIQLCLQKVLLHCHCTHAC